MNLLGKNFEGLTIITDIKKKKGIHYFIVDSPSGFGEIDQCTAGLRVLFEFTGRDHIQYAFRTQIGEMLGEDIWLKCPEALERIQRRKEFRIAPPLGTKVCFTIDDQSFETNAINISGGGALVNLHSKLHDDKLFHVDALIRDLTLVCREKVGKVRIDISQAEIRRIDKIVKINRYVYALQFSDMTLKEDDKLRDYISRCQRDLIKKRRL